MVFKDFMESVLVLGAPVEGRLLLIFSLSASASLAFPPCVALILSCTPADFASLPVFPVCCLVPPVLAKGFGSAGKPPPLLDATLPLAEPGPSSACAGPIMGAAANCMAAKPARSRPAAL